MNDISIVIISLNAEKFILQVLDRAKMLSNDIVVVDSGSSDKTEKYCKEYELSFSIKKWSGYGAQKNYGNSLARHDWILSLDTDEIMTEELVREISQLTLDAHVVYSIPFANSYCGKLIRFGRWRNEHHARLFHKSSVSWNEEAVHEGLNIAHKRQVNLNHKIIHYSMSSKAEHLTKAEKYALMGAKNLFKAGRKSTIIKQYINPVFRFVLDYFIFLGFLDGRLGFQIAWITAKETYWKYKHLKNMS